ncbi:hypothetical protein BpHYR1_050054 [Brachionus plicatilis]|uniref:Uncharacterized protein n=1 Tax=Brachionus plicatilis TaxID=10195 RepID=A0A3M7P3U1_BRAPC|nr:hypothetical protein BpHYR1_050054 [Brachionus plicatilis]
MNGPRKNNHLEGYHSKLSSIPSSSSLVKVRDEDKKNFQNTKKNKKGGLFILNHTISILNYIPLIILFKDC